MIALLAGDSGLGRRGLTTLHRLRVSQREIIHGSRGAFVKIEPLPSPPLIDLGQAGRDSPLVADYHSLIVLDLAREFPGHGERLRKLLAARRAGLDLSMLAAALWHDDGVAKFAEAAANHECDARLLAATLWIALKPLYEAVAHSLVRYIDLPQGGQACPLCGGPAWARCGSRLRCGVCETAWEGTLEGNWREHDGVQPRGATLRYDTKSMQRVVDLEDKLFEHAYDAGPFVELLRLLESKRMDKSRPDSHEYPRDLMTDLRH